MSAAETRQGPVSPSMAVEATPELIAALEAALAAGRHDLAPEHRFELEALRLQAMANRCRVRILARREFCAMEDCDQEPAPGHAHCQAHTDELLAELREQELIDRANAFQASEQ